MARTNHKTLHRKLEELGYEVFVCDYSEGTHCYQFQKGSEWNEYVVNSKKRIIDASVSNSVKELFKEHYESQGYTINF